MRNAAWLALVVAVVGAAAGRLDPARFTRTTTENSRGDLRLEYSRFGAAAMPIRLRLFVKSSPDADGPLRVRLSARYTRRMRIDRISPEPTTMQEDGEDVVFVFLRAPGAIELDLQPLDLGRQEGRIAVASERSIDFTQYVVP